MEKRMTGTPGELSLNPAPPTTSGTAISSSTTSINSNAHDGNAVSSSNVHDGNVGDSRPSSASNGINVNSDPKNCTVCGTEFVWKPKWEQCWDQVVTCSDKCKKKARNQVKNEEATGGSSTKAAGGSSSSSTKDTTGAKSSTGRLKQCAVCNTTVELAYRCKYLPKQTDWRFVCRPCWPTVSGTGYLEEKRNLKPNKEGNANSKDPDDDSRKAPLEGGPGVKDSTATDVAGPNPHYVYGGTWKTCTGLAKSELS